MPRKIPRQGSERRTFLEFHCEWSGILKKKSEDRGNAAEAGHVISHRKISRGLFDSRSNKSIDCRLKDSIVAGTEKNITERNTMRLSLKLLIIVSLAFCAVSASAADSIQHISIPPGSTPPPPPPIDCSKYSLTGEKFMELYHDIAMHGNLKDIPFIEKTLQVKFKSEYEVVSGDKPDIHDIHYQALSLLGAPININMEIIDDNDTENVRPGVAGISFSSGSYASTNYIEQCLRITRDQFASYFTTEATPFPRPRGRAPHYYMAKNLDGPDENPKMKIAYTPAINRSNTLNDNYVISNFGINQINN
jgi:hypothetical protein